MNKLRTNDFRIYKIRQTQIMFCDADSFNDWLGSFKLRSEVFDLKVYNSKIVNNTVRIKVSNYE